MRTGTVEEGKTIAIISYITIIGTIIAFIMNQDKKNSFAAFHIRQALGLALLFLVISFLDRIIGFGWTERLLNLGVLALVIIGILGAIQGEEKKVPLLGDQFQEWFRNIG